MTCHSHDYTMSAKNLLMALQSLNGWSSLDRLLYPVDVKLLTAAPMVKVVTWSRGLTWRSQVEENPVPIPHPTNLALFGHKTLYRFNQGAHTIAGELKSEQGAEPPHFNHRAAQRSLVSCALVFHKSSDLLRLIRWPILCSILLFRISRLRLTRRVLINRVMNLAILCLILTILTGIYLLTCQEMTFTKSVYSESTLFSSRRVFQL